LPELVGQWEEDRGTADIREGGDLNERSALAVPGEGGAGRMRPIYLDHAATTPMRPEVLEAMLPYFSDTFGNASSIHTFGQKAKKALEDAREVVADCLGAEAGEIYFTSGGTESDNLAIKGVAHANRKKGTHLVTSTIEHHAVLNCCSYLENEGYEVAYAPVHRFGILDVEALENAIQPNTVLVTVMLANNETGTLQPVSEIARITGERGVPLHTDAVQAIGKIPVNVDELGVDLLSVSGHKIHAPKGIGALYVRRGTRIDPLLHGGHHERQVRAGTENVAAIVGLAKAVELVTREMPRTVARLRTLRDRLELGIRERIEHVHLNGHSERRLPNILNMGFEFVEGESLLLTLDLQGIAVATGSACTSGAVGPSHVLQAMGVDPAVAQGSLRFSLGRNNTEEEMDFVVKTLSEIVDRLRAVSPLYVGRAEE
jgi:cysteine desulfurase